MNDQTGAASPRDAFDDLVVPTLFSDASTETAPELCFIASGSMSGRSRATYMARPRSVLVNARDLELLARRLDPRGEAEAQIVAAEWLQRVLAVARERQVSVTLEGRFRSPDLLSGVSQLFASAGFRTRLAMIAERASEVRMSDASRALDALRRRAEPVTAGGWEPVDVAAILAAAPADRVTVLDRTGAIVVDAERGTRKFEGARSALEEASATKLGTLRSILWLSQLRRMTRFLAEGPPAPGWALDELIALHEIALEEIVPELPISAESDTRHVQELRLSASLAALQSSREPALRIPALPNSRGPDRRPPPRRRRR